jgi:hypothetical protein
LIVLILLLDDDARRDVERRRERERACDQGQACCEANATRPALTGDAPCRMLCVPGFMQGRVSSSSAATILSVMRV